MIELSAASVAIPTEHGDRAILESTTLRLAEHRIALIGSNGSGKSTLAKLLNGLIEPTSGSVTVHVEGKALDTRRHGAAVRRHVGFIFTDPASQIVMPTVGEDVALSFRRSHPSKRERLAAVSAHLAHFGLEGREEQSVYTLSGGQQQLLALASVLAVRPSIVVADEPTTLLDLRNSRRITELLLSLEQQVIVATHDLDLAERCDRTLVIEEGRVVFDGVGHAAVAHYRSLV